MVPAGQRRLPGRPVAHRGPTRAETEPQLPGRQQRLEAQPPEHRVHVHVDDDLGQARVHVRALRDAGAHRHAPGKLARVLDPGQRDLVAGVGRGRHHGVLREQSARERVQAERRQLRLVQRDAVDLVARRLGVDVAVPRVGHGMGRAAHRSVPRRQVDEPLQRRRRRAVRADQPVHHQDAVRAGQPGARGDQRRRSREHDLPHEVRGRLRAHLSEVMRRAPRRRGPHPLHGGGGGAFGGGRTAPVARQRDQVHEREQRGQPHAQRDVPERGGAGGQRQQRRRQPDRRDREQRPQPWQVQRPAEPVRHVAVT